MHAAPPPVAAVGAAVEIERVEVIRRVIDVMIADSTCALHTRDDIVSGRMKDYVKPRLFPGLLWMDHDKRIPLGGLVSPPWPYPMLENFQLSSAGRWAFEPLAFVREVFRWRPVSLLCEERQRCRQEKCDPYSLHFDSFSLAAGRGAAPASLRPATVTRLAAGKLSCF